MQTDRVTASFVALLWLSASAWAQQPVPAPPPSSTSAAPAAAQTKAPPSADALGVSLKAIRAQLQQQAPTPKSPSGNGLRYDFYVDVLGKRPVIDFMKYYGLTTERGNQWGNPTHQEILNVMSPVWVNQARPGAIVPIGRK